MVKPLIIFYCLLYYFFILPQYYCSHAKILINEVLPYPADGNEVIELIFISDIPQETELNLKDWSIWDELTSPSCLYIFEEEIISSEEFLVKTFNNKLNNSGDSIIIKNPAGEIIDKFSYTFSEKDFSFSRISHDQDDFLLSIPTIGNSNIIPSPTLIPTPTPTDGQIQSKNSTLNEESNQSYDVFLENNDFKLIEFSLKEESYLQKELNDLKSQQENLVQRIKLLKNTINQHKNQELHIAKPLNKNQFFTSLKYKTTIISNIGVVGVIIGGLFFLIASRIIYE